MATKVFCDRCGEEIQSGKAQYVELIYANDEHFTLCPSCFLKVKDVLKKTKE